jgi:hypothetical protein
VDVCRLRHKNLLAIQRDLLATISLQGRMLAKLNGAGLGMVEEDAPATGGATCRAGPFGLVEFSGSLVEVHT